MLLTRRVVQDSLDLMDAGGLPTEEILLKSENVCVAAVAAEMCETVRNMSIPLLLTRRRWWKRTLVSFRHELQRVSTLERFSFLLSAMVVRETNKGTRSLCGLVNALVTKGD